MIPFLMFLFFLFRRSKGEAAAGNLPIETPCRKCDNSSNVANEKVIVPNMLYCSWLKK